MPPVRAGRKKSRGKKTARPPTRGVGAACVRLPPGRSTTPTRDAVRERTGERRAEREKKRKKRRRLIKTRAAKREEGRFARFAI